MKRRTRICIFAGLVLAVSVFLMVRPGQRGPLYNGKHAADWLDDFSGNEETSMQAKEAFRQMGTQAVPYLLRELTNKSAWRDTYVGFKSKLPKAMFKITPPSPRIDWQRRQFAALALGELGTAATAAIPALVAAVNHSEIFETDRTGTSGFANQWSPHARAAAIQALWKIAPESHPGVKAIVGALQQKYYYIPSVADSARMVLAELGPNFKSEIPVIIQHLKYYDTRNPRPLPASIYSVGGLAPGYAESVPKLMVVLKDPDPRAREAAAYDLGGLRLKELVAAKTAIPALLETLQDRDEIVRVTTAEAILKIDRTQSTNIVPTLIELLQGQDYTVRLRAVDLLRQIGPDSASALPALEKAMHDESGIVRVWVAEAIAQVRQLDTNRVNPK